MPSKKKAYYTKILTIYSIEFVKLYITGRNRYFFFMTTTKKDIVSFRKLDSAIFDKFYAADDDSVYTLQKKTP
jgi:hypothetical protein